MKTSIAPWLSVKSPSAISFYTAAFDAKEVYRMEDPGGGVVVRLSVDGAEFWVSQETGEGSQKNTAAEQIKIILTVSNPDLVFETALNAGATQVFPVAKIMDGGLEDCQIHLVFIGRSVGLFLNTTNFEKFLKTIRR